MEERGVCLSRRCLQTPRPATMAMDLNQKQARASFTTRKERRGLTTGTSGATTETVMEDQGLEGKPLGCQAMQPTI